MGTGLGFRDTGSGVRVQGVGFGVTDKTLAWICIPEVEGKTHVDAIIIKHLDTRVIRVSSRSPNVHCSTIHHAGCPE